MTKQVMVQPNTIVRIIFCFGVSWWRVMSDRQQTADRVCRRITGHFHSRRGDALKGGGDVGSRVRIAAAACLVASGLLAGGASISMAFADSPPIGDDSGGKHTSGENPKPNPDEMKTTPGGDRKDENPKGDESGKDPGDVKPGDEKQGADDGKNGDNNNNGDNGVGNPGNGNCGNSGGNGNASGCGGGSGPDDPPPTKPTTPPTTKPEEPPPPPDDPGECDDRNKDQCSPGWPWWPWPWNVGQPPGPGGSGGGGGHPEVPSGRPGVLPRMQLPPELMPPTTGPAGPTVVDAEPGVGIAAAQLPIAPITLPVIVAPAIGVGGGGGPAGAPALPVTPRGVTAEPLAGREPLPANVGSNVAVPAASYRIGYTEYLRNAGLSQVAALAVPGVAGMLVLTCAGGLLGYRQAKAGHAVHTSGTARFVN
jgi:hypothetical protein